MPRVLSTAVAIGCAALIGSHCGSRPQPQGLNLPPRRAELTLDDRAAWKAALDWPADCEDAFQASRVSDDAGLVFHQLAANISLVEVLCALGSYQPSSVFIMLDERAAPRAEALTFRAYRSEDGETVERFDTSELWGEPTVLSSQQELTMLNLSRQIGDCGIWTRYSLRDGTPRVLDVRGQLPCPSTPGRRAISESGGPPAEWKEIGQ